MGTLKIIEAEAKLEFDSIWDELIWKASHDDEDYVDPAAVVRMISAEVDRRFMEHHLEMKELYRNFLLELEDLKAQSTIECRKSVLRSTWT